MSYNKPQSVHVQYVKDGENLYLGHRDASEPPKLNLSLRQKTCEGEAGRLAWHHCPSTEMHI